MCTRPPAVLEAGLEATVSLSSLLGGTTLFNLDLDPTQEAGRNVVDEGEEGSLQEADETVPDGRKDNRSQTEEHAWAAAAPHPETDQSCQGEAGSD